MANESAHTSSYDPIYVNLASESDDPDVTQIESLCVACEENGITKLLMTKIPHFREVILTSFECEHCGNKNNGVQSATTQECGVSYVLEVKSTNDFSRQLVISEHATVIFPELDFEIPPRKTQGEVTNVEGLIRRASENLMQEQPQRKVLHPELADQIEEFNNKLIKLLDDEKTFIVRIDDPSGNSFVENPNAPLPDPHLVKSTYERTKAQNLALGISVPETNLERNLSVVNEDEELEETKSTDIRNEVLQFNTLCEKCSVPVKTNMKVTEVPNFKEVIIMATNCDNCGYRTNEVKGGNGISDLGKKISLKITDAPIDMSRDVLKSETCDVLIPELDIHVGAGILGGKFTTVEGLLNDIKNDLSNNPFLSGDSAENETKSKIESIMADIDKVINGNLIVTVVMDDPAGNSYVQNVFEPDKDPAMTIEDYERSFDQNEELGLNDIKTENYTEN